MELINVSLTLSEKSKFKKYWPENDIDSTEILLYLAFTIFQGLVPLPTIKDYFKDTILWKFPLFKAFFTRDKFLFLHRKFRIHSISKLLSNENNDKLAKLREVIDVVVPSWRKFLIPGRKLSVDETMVLFKGREDIKQYNPKKPVKFGVKINGLADAESGYMLDWRIYTGKNSKSTEDIVLELVDSYTNQDYLLYMDNFFSSIPLFEKLKSLGFGSTGTIRKNRKGLPKANIDAKLNMGECKLLSNEEINLYTYGRIRKKSLLFPTYMVESKLQRRDMMVSNG